MRTSPRLLPSKAKNLGILTLNRPQALHALTLDMIECLQDVLPQWIQDETVRGILLKANNSETKRPAFCAGGDVKAVWEKGIANDPALSEFFYQEYQANHIVATCPKPIISIWDGVVMGGGVGLSVHGEYRIAVDTTLFAMPETAIGLFPDVGSMYWMPRLLSIPMARYLALTGWRIKAADLLYTGIATHYVPSDKLSGLEVALSEATDRNNDDIDEALANVLQEFHQSIPTDGCHLAKHRRLIEYYFKAETIENIIDSLQEGTNADIDNEFAAKALASLEKASPTSLKVTLEGLRRGAAIDNIGEDLQMEYRMACASTLPGADFYEGVRSVLLDKDHAPKWKPSKIEDVKQAEVDAFFAPIEKEWFPLAFASRL